MGELCSAVAVLFGSGGHATAQCVTSQSRSNYLRKKWPRKSLGHEQGGVVRLDMVDYNEEKRKRDAERVMVKERGMYTNLHECCRIVPYLPLLPS